MQNRERYSYEGPVMVFGTIVQNKWYGETLAESKKKAKSNLTYQWKKSNGKLATAKVELPGEIILMR